MSTLPCNQQASSRLLIVVSLMSSSCSLTFSILSHFPHSSFSLGPPAWDALGNMFAGFSLYSEPNLCIQSTSVSQLTVDNARFTLPLSFFSWCLYNVNCYSKTIMQLALPVISNDIWMHSGTSPFVSYFTFVQACICILQNVNKNSLKVISFWTMPHPRILQAVAPWAHWLKRGKVAKWNCYNMLYWKLPCQC